MSVLYDGPTAAAVYNLVGAGCLLAAHLVGPVTSVVNWYMVRRRARALLAADIDIEAVGETICLCVVNLLANASSF
jgi:hypothetical protein